MKKKKLYEGELSKIDNIKMNLETQCIHLESATGTAQAFSAMSAGTKTMKKIHQTVGIDQVDEVMMDIQDEMQMAEEINNAIGQSIDPAMGMLDDDDLMKELQQLDCDDLEQQMNKAETGKLNFPQAPSTKHGISKKEEEDIRRLEAELAM
jgi:charged multivesicular body protein 4